LLLYLDNVQSMDRGRNRSRGLNENLGREILELHTLGVDAGYSQDDVVALARALAGWSTPSPADARSGVPAPPLGCHGAIFRDSSHGGRALRVLVRTYAQPGPELGAAILADLAREPAAARHLSRKLAMHFVGDQPPPALVERMAESWMDTGGEL